MNAQDIALDGEILRIVAGSNLHGLNVPGEDDRDELGICIEPPEYVIGLQRFEQYIYRSQPEGVRSGPGDLDRVIYSLRKWTRLAAKGHPTMLLPLFAPRSTIIHGTAEGFDLRRHRSLFVTKEAGARFLGYLGDQRDRLEGKRGGAPYRPDYVERYGYDTKYAMHMTRLAYQGIELMETGQLTLPLPTYQQEWCMKIRRGEIEKDRVLADVRGLEGQLITATYNSHLPEAPDMTAINKLLVEMYRGWWP